LGTLGHWYASEPPHNPVSSRLAVPGRTETPPLAIYLQRRSQAHSPFL